MLLLLLMRSPGSTQSEVGTGVVQTRFCGTPCSGLHSELQDFIPLAFLAGSCSIVQVQNGEGTTRQVQ